MDTPRSDCNQDDYDPPTSKSIWVHLGEGIWECLCNNCSPAREIKIVGEWSSSMANLLCEIVGCPHCHNKRNK
jgi:hypothetical protein